MMDRPDARQRALALCEITPSQQIIIDVWLRERFEKLRHWERKSGDPSIYIEYLNGVAFLDGVINDEINNINKKEAAKQKSKQHTKR